MEALAAKYSAYAQENKKLEDATDTYKTLAAEYTDVEIAVSDTKSMLHDELYAEEQEFEKIRKAYEAKRWKTLKKLDSLETEYNAALEKKARVYQEVVVPVIQAQSQTEKAFEDEMEKVLAERGFERGADGHYDAWCDLLEEIRNNAAS